MDDSLVLAFGIIAIGALGGTLVAVCASIAVGAFFGAGWGFLAFAGFAALGTLLALAVMRGALKRLGERG